MKRISLALVCLLFPAFAALASDKVPVAMGEQLEISAAGSLEWNREAHQYIARGEALARQGETEIAADTLVADYRAKAGGGTVIAKLTATGHVVITSAGTNKAYGETAIYSLDDQQAVMTGGDLRLESPEQIVRARDRFEYWTQEGRLVAVGDASVIQTATGNKLAAPTISAWFLDDGSGHRVMDRALAEGGTTITTSREIVTGRTGTYTRGTRLAHLDGPVKVVRGPNVLEGDRADVNLETGVSTLFAGPTGKGGRVTGVFYPGSDKEPDISAPAPANLDPAPAGFGP